MLPACWNPRAGLHHYLGLMRRGVADDLTTEQVRLKRLFYALRSTLAARWIRQHPADVPPMEFEQLRELLPVPLRGDVDELLVRKAMADEKTTVPRPAALVEFLQAEYEVALAARESLPLNRPADPTPALDALFRTWLSSAS